MQNAAATAARAGAKSTSRRVTSAVVAGLAVVGFSVAIVAPAGLAMSAGEPAHASVTTAYALAARDAQNITVSVHGVTPTAQARDAFDVYVKPKPTPTPEPVVASSSSSSSDSGSSDPGPMFYSGGGAPAEWMAAAGIASSDWGYVDYIVSRESGWNPNATNSGSGACGLVQALPCSKVPGNGYDPVDNLRWANGYAVGRYGSWGSAVAFWSANNWW
ncbi:transglycosylase SLT domain-containing protein [Microbacterium azadirachtae]|uniref:aggregation-promoting factor C-terminal-like domain-containing protein n=1 Tax=Microbacterium azadirachtae TaxID=582680 RepID=UPI000A4D9A5D|nr:transglycosylase SLT domain-containing protein [Microbacterium azadirachtae]